MFPCGYGYGENKWVVKANISSLESIHIEGQTWEMARNPLREPLVYPQINYKGLQLREKRLLWDYENDMSFEVRLPEFNLRTITQYLAHQRQITPHLCRWDFQLQFLKRQIVEVSNKMYVLPVILPPTVFGGRKLVDPFSETVAIPSGLERTYWSQGVQKSRRDSSHFQRNYCIVRACALLWTLDSSPHSVLSQPHDGTILHLTVHEIESQKHSVILPKAWC